jgi:hypothetical protein
MTYDEVQIRSKSAIIYTSYAKAGNSTSFTSALTINDRIKQYEQKQLFDQSYVNPLGELVKEKKPYSGVMTKGAKKRLTKAVSLMVQSSKQRYIYNPVTQRRQLFKMSFVTLTVSSTSKMITAKEAHKELLEPFLLYLRRRHQVRNYVWKAELQKRGQIHYHITLDQFVLYTDIRDKWNELQDKAGYLEDYKALNTGRQANSTDVHAIKKVKNIEAYMVKYMSKTNSDDTGTEGKVWDCSVTLKRSKYYSTALTYQMERSILYAEQAGLAEVIHFDHFSMVKFNERDASYILEPDSLAEYYLAMDRIRTGTLFG